MKKILLFKINEDYICAVIGIIMLLLIVHFIVSLWVFGNDWQGFVH